MCKWDSVCQPDIRLWWYQSVQGRHRRTRWVFLLRNWLILSCCYNKCSWIWYLVWILVYLSAVFDMYRVPNSMLPNQISGIIQYLVYSLYINLFLGFWFHTFNVSFDFHTQDVTRLSWHTVFLERERVAHTISVYLSSGSVTAIRTVSINLMRLTVLILHVIQALSSVIGWVVSLEACMGNMLPYMP